VVLRCNLGTSPEYPRDQIAVVEGDNRFLNGSVRGETTYVYRVAILKDGAVSRASNTLTAEVPGAISASLSSTTENGVSQLSWSTSISGISPCITHYVLIRSDESPAGSISSSAGQKTYSLGVSRRDFVDSGLTPVRTYSYRLAVCRGD